MLHCGKILLLTLMGNFLFGCINSAPSPVPTPIVTLSPEQKDDSPFTGVPCSAPCWRGLEIGRSNENDVIAVLPTLEFIKQDAIQMYRTSMPGINGTYGPGVNIVAECINSTNTCLDLKVVNNVLTKIVVGLNYEITMDEAIEYLGEPDSIGVAPIGGEYFVCEVHIVWVSSRLDLVSTFKAQENIEAVEKYCDIVYDTGKVLSSMFISEARYLSASELAAIMSPESSNTFLEFTGTIPKQ
jgi:hypothetical protein